MDPEGREIALQHVGAALLGQPRKDSGVAHLLEAVQARAPIEHDRSAIGAVDDRTLIRAAILCAERQGLRDPILSRGDLHGYGASDALGAERPHPVARRGQT